MTTAAPVAGAWYTHYQPGAHDAELLAAAFADERDPWGGPCRRAV